MKIKTNGDGCPLRGDDWCEIESGPPQCNGEPAPDKCPLREGDVIVKLIGSKKQRLKTQAQRIEELEKRIEELEKSLARTAKNLADATKGIETLTAERDQLKRDVQAFQMKVLQVPRSSPVL